jgi:hypothetical protein
MIGRIAAGINYVEAPGECKNVRGSPKFHLLMKVTGEESFPKGDIRWISRDTSYKK